MVPRELDSNAADIPLVEWLKSSQPLPFVHRLHRFETPPSPLDVLEAYESMLSQLELDTEEVLASHNWLLLEEFLLMMPRSKDTYEAVCERNGVSVRIPINGAAFSGALFVKHDDVLEHVKRVGLMEILRQVTTKS